MADTLKYTQPIQAKEGNLMRAMSLAASFLMATISFFDRISVLFALMTDLQVFHNCVLARRYSHQLAEFLKTVLAGDRA